MQNALSVIALAQVVLCFRSLLGRCKKKDGKSGVWRGATGATFDVSASQEGEKQRVREYLKNRTLYDLKLINLAFKKKSHL